MNAFAGKILPTTLASFAILCCNGGCSNVLPSSHSVSAPSDAVVPATYESILATAHRPVGAVDFVAPEVRLFQDAVARAKARGRPLLVHLTATWCPPCERYTDLSKQGDETMRAGEFQEILAGFEVLTLEEMLLSDYISEHSYLPFHVSGWPMFAAYDPKTDSWQEIFWSEANLGDLAHDLKGFLSSFESGTTAANRQAAIDAKLAEGETKWRAFLEKASAGTVEGYEVWDAYDHIELMAEVRGVAPALDMANTLVGFADTNSAIKENLYGDFVFFKIAEAAVSKRGLSYAAIERDFPELAEKTRDSGIFFLFHRSIEKLAAEQGSATAASVCRELDEFVTRRYPLVLDPVSADATEAERKTIEDGNRTREIEYRKQQLRREGFCSLLEARSQTGDREKLLAFLQNMEKLAQENAEIRMQDSALFRLAAALGQFDLATRVAERSHSEEILTFIEETRQLALADLEDIESQLESAGSTDERTALEERIAELKFNLSRYDVLKADSERVLNLWRQAFAQGLASPLSLKQ